MPYQSSCDKLHKVRMGMSFGIFPRGDPSGEISRVNTAAAKMLGSPPAVTATPSPQPPTGMPRPTWTPTSTPKPTPLTGVIVFPVFDPAAGKYNIHAAKPDGSERRLVIAKASQPSAPAVIASLSAPRLKTGGLLRGAINGDDEWRFTRFGEAARPASAPDDPLSFPLTERR